MESDFHCISSQPQLSGHLVNILLFQVVQDNHFAVAVRQSPDGYPHLFELLAIKMRVFGRWL